MYHKVRFIQWFRPLGRYAPFTVDSGLRPETPFNLHNVSGVVQRPFEHPQLKVGYR